MYYRYEINKSPVGIDKKKTIFITVLKIIALVSILSGILMYSRLYLIVPLIVIGIGCAAAALVLSSKNKNSSYVEIYVINNGDLIVTHRFSDGTEKEFLREKIDSITLSEYDVVDGYLEYDARIGDKTLRIRSNRYLYCMLEKK